VFPTLPEVLSQIPYSTIFILLLSMSLSFLTALANRLLTNREQLNAWRKEIARWNEDLGGVVIRNFFKRWNERSATFCSFSPR